MKPSGTHTKKKSPAKRGCEKAGRGTRHLPPFWSSFPASKTSRALRTDANPPDVPASAVAFPLCPVGVSKQTRQQTNKHHRCFPAESMPQCVFLPDAKSRFLEPPHFPAACTRERIFSSSSSSSSCATSFRRWSGACRPLRSSALPPPPPPPPPPPLPPPPPQSVCESV